MEVNEPASWLLTGPPLLFAHCIAGMAGWRPTTGPPLWTLFLSSAFVVYYHIVAAPGYALLSQTNNGRNETRTLLVIMQWTFATAHIMLVALVAWLMQA